MIKLPEKCLRRGCNYSPLAQIVAEDGSYICIGRNDLNKGDIYCQCWVSEDVDESTFMDKRDITDMASVLIQSLSVIENQKQ